MTLTEMRTRLGDARSRLGGRFALTLSEGGGPPCYLTHWTRPEPHAFETCRMVGAGSLAACLAALDRYVEAQSPLASWRCNAERAASSSTGTPSSADSVNIADSPRVRKA